MSKDWEKEFDVVFGDLVDHADPHARRDIKAFISEHLSRAVAKQRTQILKEVREKVIGKEEKPVKVPKVNWHGTSYLGVDSAKATRNKWRQEQLKKLKELEEGK